MYCVHKSIYKKILRSAKKFKDFWLKTLKVLTVLFSIGNMAIIPPITVPSFIHIT